MNRAIICFEDMLNKTSKSGDFKFVFLIMWRVILDPFFFSIRSLYVAATTTLGLFSSFFCFCGQVPKFRQKQKH